MTLTRVETVRLYPHLLAPTGGEKPFGSAPSPNTLTFSAYDVCGFAQGVAMLKETLVERAPWSFNNYLRVAPVQRCALGEPPISGEAGSGAIFFTGCPLRCVFCQNHQSRARRTASHHN